jgi:hypothetical protein
LTFLEFRVLIKNYGLFWAEKNVFWGVGNNAGTLLGVPAKNLTAKKIDFREQSGVYVLYADYQMVYVGQAGAGNQKLFTRLKQHTRDALAGRWNQFSWFGIRRFGEDVVQYLQVRDSNLGPTGEDMIRILWQAQQKTH